MKVQGNLSPQGFFTSDFFLRIFWFKQLQAQKTNTNNVRSIHNCFYPIPLPYTSALFFWYLGETARFQNAPVFRHTVFALFSFQVRPPRL